MLSKPRWGRRVPTGPDQLALHQPRTRDAEAGAILIWLEASRLDALATCTARSHIDIVIALIACPKMTETEFQTNEVGQPPDICFDEETDGYSDYAVEARFTTAA